MGAGDIFITFFVAAVFGIGIYVGVKLYKLNMRDFKAKKEIFFIRTKYIKINNLKS